MDWWNTTSHVRCSLLVLVSRLHYCFLLLIYLAKIYFESTIMKLLTSFFRYHYIGIKAPQAQVSDARLLTAPLFISHYFAINRCRCNCNCFQGCTVLNINSRFRFRNPERLWTVRLVYHDVQIINDDSIRRLGNAILLRHI